MISGIPLQYGEADVESSPEIQQPKLQKIDWKMVALEESIRSVAGAVFGIIAAYITAKYILGQKKYQVK